MRKKENLNTIVTILIIIILISFVWGYNLLGIRTTINEGIDKIQDLSLSSNVKITCPQGIIPQEIDLLEYEGSLWGYEEWGNGQIYAYWPPSWLDGQKMTIYPLSPKGTPGEVSDLTKSYCVKGSNEGQNINYYYCDVGYSKTITDISEEGSIGETKTISYNIKLILEKQEHLKEIKKVSIDRYEIISSECLKA